MKVKYFKVKFFSKIFHASTSKSHVSLTVLQDVSQTPMAFAFKETCHADFMKSVCVHLWVCVYLRRCCCFISFVILLIFIAHVNSSLLSSCSFSHCIFNLILSLRYSRHAESGYLSVFDCRLGTGREAHGSRQVFGSGILASFLILWCHHNICSQIRTLLPAARASRRHVLFFRSVFDMSPCVTAHCSMH